MLVGGNSMFLSIFSPMERRYRHLRAERTELGRRRLEGAGLHGEQTVIEILRTGLSVSQTGLRPRPTAEGIRLFTPRQLADVLRLLLDHDPEIASYLVMVVLPRTLPRHISASDFGPMVTYTLGPEFQGDVMMALEKSRAVLPDQAEKGAEVLARSLCLMPSLRRAKETYQNLGEPYTHEPLDERGMGKLLTEQFVPDGTLVDLGSGRKGLTVDSLMRELVAEKIRALSTEAAELILGR